MNNFIHLLFRYKWEDSVLDAINQNSDLKCRRRIYKAFRWMVKIAREGGFLMKSLMFLLTFVFRQVKHTAIFVSRYD